MGCVKLRSALELLLSMAFHGFLVLLGRVFKGWVEGGFKTWGRGAGGKAPRILEVGVWNELHSLPHMSSSRRRLNPHQPAGDPQVKHLQKVNWYQHVRKSTAFAVTWTMRSSW